MMVRLQFHCTRRRWLAWTGNLLLLAGIACLLVWAWQMGKGALYQHVQEAEFAKALSPGGPAPDRVERPRAQTPQADDGPILPNITLPRSPTPAAHPRALFDFLRPDPQLIGRLESPEINLSVMVREGVDDDTLLRAAGHLPSSALPGQAGNFVVLAHRDTFFRALRGITRGASLKVRTRTGQFTYIVDSVQVTEPDSIRLEQGPEPSATLITCFPFTYIGPAPRRMVVHARLAPQH